jgi:hypothetical protein
MTLPLIGSIRTLPSQVAQSHFRRETNRQADEHRAELMDWSAA